MGRMLLIKRLNIILIVIFLIESCAKNSLTSVSIFDTDKAIMEDYLRNDLIIDSLRINNEHKNLTNYRIISIGHETIVCLTNCNDNVPSISFEEALWLNPQDYKNKKVIVTYYPEETNRYVVKSDSVFVMYGRAIDELISHVELQLNDYWVESCKEKYKNISEFYPQYKVPLKDLIFTRTLQISKEKVRFIDSYGSYDCDEIYLEKVEEYTKEFLERENIMYLYLNVDFYR